MRSFEIPPDELMRLEARLQDRIEKVEGLRKGFPAVLERLGVAAGQLKASLLGPLVSRHARRSEEAIPPTSPSEALAFARRHPADNGRDGGYHRMVHRIRKDFGELRLSSDLLRDLHRQVVGSEARDPGKWKTSDNFFPIVDQYGAPVSSILTVGWEQTPEYMGSLEERFLSAWDSGARSKILLIALYWLDLLGIHPFHDGNGRVSRLAVMLLLLQAEHEVARHMSLESLVGRRRTEYITSLRASLNGWLESRHDPYMWCTFVIDSICTAYLDISDRTETLISTIEHAEAVRAAIEKMPRKFLTTDLLADLPDLPEGVLPLVLNLASEEGTLLPSPIEGKAGWEKA